MDVWERTRLQAMHSCIDMLSDIDRYVLYFLLASAPAIGCDKWDSEAGVFLIGYALVAFVAHAAAGLLADAYARRAHILLMLSQGVAFTSTLLMYLPPVLESYGFFMFVYLLHWLGNTAALMFFWKIVKVRVEYLCGGDVLKQEELINRIGTVGDIGSRTAILIILGSAYIVAVRTEEPRYRLVKAIVFGGVLLLQLILLALCFTISRDYVAVRFKRRPSLESSPPASDSSLTSDASTSTPVTSTSSAVATINVDPTLRRRAESEGAAPTTTTTEQRTDDSPPSGHTTDAEASDSSDEENGHEQVGLLQTNKAKSTDSKKDRMCSCASLMKHMRLLTRNKLAVAMIMLALLLFIVYRLFSYPVSLDQAFGKVHRPGTFCDGLFDYVLAQGAILQIAYIVGGVLYWALIIPMSPVTFLRWVLPALAIVVMVMGCVLFWPVSLVVSAVLASVATMIPYFLNAYAVYVVSSVVRVRYFGFTQAVYWASSDLVELIPFICLLAHAPQNVVLVLALVFLVTSIIMSVINAKKYERRLTFRSHN